MFLSQPSMGIAWLPRYNGKALLPFRNKAQFQKLIVSFDGVDPRQPHLLHQAVLQRFKQPLDAPLGLRTVRRNPFDPQFVQSTPELRACRIATELFGKRCQTRGSKDAVAIGVVRQWTPIASQPASQSLQVLFGAVVLGKAAPDAAGRIIDQSDQLTGRPTILQPAKWRTILHH